MPRPRVIKTHLPVQFLPDDFWVTKPRIVYCSREPKDVAVSMYHFSSHITKFEGIEDFLDSFLKDECMYCPYRDHRLNYWNIPEYPNILYLTYEGITANMDETIKEVAKFLGVTLDEEHCQKLMHYFRFDKMKGASMKI